MTSNQQQQYYNHNLRKNLATSNSAPVQTTQSDVKQIPFDKELQTKESSSSNILSRNIHRYVDRASSASAIDKLVGSNKLFVSTKKQTSIFDIRKSSNIKKK